MSIEENKALVRRYFAIWNGEEKLEALDEIIAPAVVDHMAYEGQQSGVEGYREFIQVWRAAFPDLHSVAEDMIAEGDRVATRWSATGTHLGPFHELPPTGRSISFVAITINRIAGGKVTDEWFMTDWRDFNRQLGIEG
jgi:steroid delta-isomerase-like uncharacterized protein